MKLDITTSGNFNNTIKWLNKANKIPTRTLNTMGREGVRQLQRKTPIDTGVTARSWGYVITTDRSGAELGFVNYHRPYGADIARMIQLGHGTGTGGYVPPIDYINPALRGLFSKAGDQIAKEMFK